MQRVERAGQHDAGGRRRGRQLAIGPRGHAREAPGEELVDEIAGLHDGLRVVLVAVQETSRRRRGDTARAGEPHHDGARHDILFARAIAAAFRKYDRAVVGAGAGGDGDVETVLALSGTIGDEPGCRAEAHQVGAGRLELRGALAGALRQRHRRLGAAGLRRLEAQERGQRPRIVGHQRLEQQPRSAGHPEQLGDRPAAAAGDGEHRLTAGGVHRRDRLPPRRVRQALGSAGIHDGHARMVEEILGGVNGVQWSSTQSIGRGDTRCGFGSGSRRRWRLRGSPRRRRPSSRRPSATRSSAFSRRAARRVIGPASTAVPAADLPRRVRQAGRHPRRRQGARDAAVEAGARRRRFPRLAPALRHRARDLAAAGSRRARPRAIARSFRRRWTSRRAGRSDPPITSSRWPSRTRCPRAPATSTAAS